MFKQGFIGLIFAVIAGVAIVVSGYLILNPNQVRPVADNNTATTTGEQKSAENKPVVSKPVVVPAPEPEPDLPVKLPEPEPEPTPEPEPKPTLGPDNQTVELGNEFTLGLGQVATVYQGGLKVKVVHFYNNPCKPGVQCFWSGQGVELQYTSGNEVKTGIDITEAYGYKITIKKTDYETYVVLVVEKP